MPFTPLQKFREQPTLKQGRASTGRWQGYFINSPAGVSGNPASPSDLGFPFFPPGFHPCAAASRYDGLGQEVLRLGGNCFLNFLRQ